MKTLIINAHPKNIKDTNNNSYTLKVLNYLIEKLEKSSGKGTLKIIDLYKSEIPEINEDYLNIIQKLQNKEALTETEKEITSKRNSILTEFKEYKQVVIALPLYNLGIPSKLKDYIDNISVAGETFKYTEQGPIGLLNDGRKVLVILSSGGLYENTENDFANDYLKGIFNFIGYDNYNILRIQETAYKDRDELLEKAYKEAAVLIKDFI